MAGLLDYLSYGLNPIGNIQRGLLDNLGEFLISRYQDNQPPQADQSAIPGVGQNSPSPFDAMQWPYGPNGRPSPPAAPQAAPLGQFAPPPSPPPMPPPTDVSARSRAPQMAPPQQFQPPPALGENSGNFLDKLNAGLQSLGNGGSIIGSLTGNYTDPQTIAQQNLKSQWIAYQQAGLSPQEAYIAVTNPKAAEKLLAKISPTYSPHNVGNTAGSFNPATGEFKPSYTDTKYEKLGPGENLVAVGGSGGQGKTVASGGPQQPPKDYLWNDPNDPSKGMTAIEGSAATQISASEAGRLAMMKTAQQDLPNAREVLMAGRTRFGAGKGNVAGSVTGIGDYARAERTIQLGVEAALRAMTGQAAPEGEVKRYTNLFTPGKFDSRETATQKLNQLDDFMTYAEQFVMQGRGAAGNVKPFRPSDPLGIRR